MKKILSLVLALLMSVSVATVGLAAGTTTTAIADTATAADTYAEAIAVLENYGIMKGINPDTFDPDADSDIQRYQMALFCGRIATGWIYDTQWTNGGVNNSGFDDLEGTPAASFYGAISYAAQKGIIEGYGNKKFGPTDGIRYKDALTMVLRTLEYTGLSYPWGNIETAERLGLTKGITGVGYDDILNRGEVAQIIYNALFITTKNTGDTLGARNFGDNLGWKTIIITATDRAIVDPADKDIPGKVPSGAVGFRVVAADGTLEGTTYYIGREYLGIGTGAHDDEAALGAAYSALFTIGSDGLVKSLVAKSLFVKNVKNYGLPTKDKDTGKYPIETALDGLTLVSKFGKDNYINAYSWNTNEIIIKNALGTDATYTKGSHLYAIDWKTGNILKVDADGDIEVTIGDKTVNYSVAWYYNSLLGKYFELKINKVKGGDVEIVGINILDDVSELGDLMSKDTYTGGLVTLNKDTIKKATAYANLDLYSLAGTKTADYGLYTQKAFGLFKEETVNVCGHDKPGYTITALDAVAEAAWKAYSTDPFEGAKVVKQVQEGKCGDHSTDIAYLTGEAVESGDYVIYSYNDQTGELNIFKNITKLNDKDNFVGTGIVRAYNLSKRTVTIGETTYTFDYDELLGNGMKLNPDKALSRAAYGKLLGDSFMNYVKFVVCDGKLVYIAGNVMNDSKYIIVDSYAGISADGYVVVNGYKSDDLKYTQIRIGAYDQWLKGDLYNYALNYNMKDLFSKGSVYAITSYDKTNDAYYVKTVAIADANTTINGVEYIGYKNIAGLTETYEVEFDGNGYKHETIAGEDKGWKRASADDKYVFLLQKPVEDEDFGYAPIVVYTGKGNENWFAKGVRLKGTNIIIVNAGDDTFKGFTNNQYAIYYGLVVSKNYDSAKYISAYEAEGKQLLGAYTSTVEVISLYSGELKTVKAVNKDVTVGYVYPVINGQITDDGTGTSYNEYGVTALDTGKLLQNARKTWHKYFTGTFSADYFDKEKFSAWAELTAKMYTNKAGDYVGYKDGLNGGVTVILVSINGEKVFVEDDNFTSDDYKAWVKANDVKSTTFVAVTHHLGADDGSAVIYVLANATTTSTDDEAAANSDQVAEVVTGGYISGSVTGTVTTDKDKDGNKTYTAKVDSISFEFIGAASKVNHEEVKVKDLYFGEAGKCTVEAWDSKIDGTETFKGSIVDETYRPHADEADAFCNLVKKVTIKGVDLPTDGTEVEVTFDGYKYNDEDKLEKVTYTAVVKITVVKGELALELVSVKGGDATYTIVPLEIDGKANPAVIL